MTPTLRILPSSRAVEPRITVLSSRVVLLAAFSDALVDRPELGLQCLLLSCCETARLDRRGRMTSGGNRVAQSDMCSLKLTSLWAVGDATSSSPSGGLPYACCVSGISASVKFGSSVCVWNPGGGGIMLARDGLMIASRRDGEMTLSEFRCCATGVFGSATVCGAWVTVTGTVSGAIVTVLGAAAVLRWTFGAESMGPWATSGTAWGAGNIGGSGST